MSGIEIDTVSETVNETTSAPIEKSTEQTGPVSAREAINNAMRSVEAQPRDTAGKWTGEQEAARVIGASAKAGVPSPDAPAAIAAPATSPAPETVVAAPARLSKEAQAEWDKAPPVIRAEVDRAFREMQGGIEQYRQRWEPLKQFDEMARGSGTTLDAALSSYVGMENEIRRNPIDGIAAVCRNAGLDPALVGQALSGLPPTNGSSPDIAPLMNKIAELESKIGNFSQSYEQKQGDELINAWAADKPHFEAVRQVVVQLLSAGIATDADAAYDMALRLNPQSAPITASTAAVIPAQAQTRKPTMQITGSNNAPSNGTAKPASSAREAIRRAMERAG